MTGGVRPDRLVVDDAAAVAAEAARQFVVCARDAIAERGRFRVALAGGQTPKAAYRRLGAGPDADGGLRDLVDWPRVDIFFGDERHVPPEDAESNYRMAREALLDALPPPGPSVHRMPGEMRDASAAARAYEDAVRQVFGLGADGTPRFDLVLLGLGADAHTASLFPHSAALDERTRLVVANFAPSLKAWRITMTLPLVNAARRVVFVVSGPDKAAAVRQVLEGAWSPHEHPAQLVRPEDGALLWILDRAAAADVEHRPPIQ